MKKLLTTAMVMVLGGLSAGYAAPTPGGNVDLSITTLNQCQVTPLAVAATLTELNYNWTNVADVVLSDSYPDMVECNQGAPAPTGTATSMSVGNAGFHAASGGGHFLDYKITKGEIGPVSGTGGSGEGTAATGDKYPFDLEVTIDAGQRVVAGTYTDTINIEITP